MQVVEPFSVDQIRVFQDEIILEQLPPKRGVLYLPSSNELEHPRGTVVSWGNMVSGWEPSKGMVLMYSQEHCNLLPVKNRTFVKIPLTAVIGIINETFKPPLIPIRDTLMVIRDDKSDKLAGGLVAPEMAVDRPPSSEVIALGPDRKGDGLKVGDRVIHFKYAGTEVTFYGDPHQYTIIYDVEKNVIGVFE